MVNKLIIIILFTPLFSSQWYFDDNNFWKFNTSSRDSALGGISLYKFPSLSDNEYDSNKIRIYNSNIYDQLINYNNIFYSHNFFNINFLGNSVYKINFSFFNRKLDNIIGTSEIWNDEINAPLNPSDINSSLVDNYSHNDFSFLVDFFLKNNLGDFGLHIMPSLSKIDSYSSNGLNLDLSYSKKINNLFFGFSFNNIYSYKKWSNSSIERFYPSFMLLLSTEFKGADLFIEIDNWYLTSENKIEDKLKLGLEYKLNSKSNIRFGYNSKFLAMGLGLNLYEKILFDYSFLSHSVLGNSNQITVIFLIQKEQKKR
tara:strand:- start:1234 stop:2172 length:939 start_codon:yes stop_codon:yes gene_type:complete